MKIRTGFVSNSSSSSFCIYGKELNRDEVIKLAVKLIPPKKLEYLEWDEEEQEFGECMSEVCEELSIVLETVSFHYAGDHNSFYFGRSWHGIGDDETGKQFKDSVKSILGDDCKTHEVEYYSY